MLNQCFQGALKYLWQGEMQGACLFHFLVAMGLRALALLMKKRKSRKIDKRGREEVDKQGGMRRKIRS